MSSPITKPCNPFLDALWRGTGGEPAALAHLTESGDESLPSLFAVSDLAAAAVGVAGLAAAELIGAAHGTRPAAHVDRRLASHWFAASAQPVGWTAPSLWDSVAGDYRTADGWIRLHTNAPHHRAAALAVLSVPEPADRQTVAPVVAQWSAEALENALVARGGCAAAMRSLSQWAAHPQGRAVAAEPLVAREDAAPCAAPHWPIPVARPLAGIRVLDLTRVIAGPVATRFLAGLGADVLRIDPPQWNEPGVLPDMTLGKRRARLDLRRADDAAVFATLLAEADVLVHGYRPGALDALGWNGARRRARNPGLVEVALDAYGWTGPWQGRRGFDSLVQMSCGIAEAGMRLTGRDRPFPLPVQALDHACGYLTAATALNSLTRRLQTGAGASSRLSLARVAAVLINGPAGDPSASLAPVERADQHVVEEASDWGPLRRLLPPVTIDGAPSSWPYPAGLLGTSSAVWLRERTGAHAKDIAHRDR